MTFSRLHVTVFLGLAVVVWAIILIVRGTAVSTDHLAPFSAVVGFLVLLGVAFEHILWRQSWLHGWFIKRPNLRGTWEVDFQSDWVNPETQQQVAPIKGFMGIVQTLSKLQMHLMTPESESWFIADRICPSPKGNGYQIIGVYTNQPEALLRGNRSEIHLGAVVLDTHGASHARPETLTGEYWTDRKTKGTISLLRFVDEVYTRYGDADRARREVRTTKHTNPNRGHAMN